MGRNYSFNRTNKMYLKKIIMVFMAVLMFVSGLLPSVSTLQVEASASNSLEEPNVSKDAEGEDNKKDFTNKMMQQNTDGITINDTDSYLIGSGYIVQMDGNNPSTLKGMVQLDRSSITNSLALGKNEDVFYANSGARLYKIYPDGQTEFVTDLEGSTAAGAITPDGNEYVYVVSNGDQLSLEFYNLVTEDKRSIPIQDHTGFTDLNGGDFAFDGNGNLWFSRWQDSPPNSILAKVDTETGDLESIIPIISNTDQTFSRAGAMGFLPNGKMLILGNYTPGVSGNGYLLELDLATGIATEVRPNDFGLGIQDAASRVYPMISPDVEIEKSVSPTGSVFPGTELTYTLKVQNTGNLASTLTTVTDALPEGTAYVPNSTTLNGTFVEDDNGESPLFTGMYVNSPNESMSGVLYAGEENVATITFNVTVDVSLPIGEEILNIAYVTYDGGNDTPSNEVINIVTDLSEIDACASPVALINGSFEEGPEEGTHGYIYFDESEVPGWLTTDDAMGANIIEIWNYRLGVPGSIRDYPAPVDGDRWAELNAYENGMLYQDVETTPGQTIYWRLSHMGRAGVDTMQVRIGTATDDPYDTIVQTQMSTGNTEWQTYTGSYTVPAGQTVTRFGFEAIDTASGSIAAGNFLDDIFLGTEPCVTADKTVSPEGEVYVGDELTYEITVKNNGGDIAADAVLEDAIPEGTEYVPNSLKIIDGPGTGDLTDEVDNDPGHFDGEKIIVELGDLPNTNDLPNGITVQFKVKALFDSIDESVTNQAQVQYKDLLKDTDEEVESNEVENPVINNDPELASTKSSTLEEKADGNTDVDNPEVGDTLRYTITTQNTVEDSLVENLVIIDTIPEGLTYVPGSLEIDGVSVTDVEDDDAGHIIEREVTGIFGDITDTDEHTVTFLVTVNEGQAGQDIINIAVVTGDNTDTDEPEEEVNVYPREPVLEAEKSAQNLEEGKEKFEVGDTIVYTIQTRNTITESLVENLMITDELPAGLEFVEGSIEVSHGGQGEFTDGMITASFGDVEDTEWRMVTFQAVIESGQSGEEIENTATADGDNVNEPEEPTTTIIVDPKDPELASSKSSSLETKAEGNTDVDNPEVGDTLRYTITTQNTVEDSLVENLVISDTIPEGLTYVPNSLEVDGESVTDAEDNDAGHAIDGHVTGNFGDIVDTDEHTVTFLVTVDEGQAGADIQNIAEVKGDNTDTDEPEEEVKVYPREPVLESEKSAQNLEEGKDKFEVGDTVVYTIQARNTVSNSMASNFTITDELPEGLEYVEGSLEVSHEGTGVFESGTVTATFGDVEDTEWRTVTFEAIVLPGQSEEVIENIAQVTIDENDDPEEPTTTIIIDPRDPEIESTKSSEIIEKRDGNTDMDNPEVGDTLLYTIQTRNIVEDSLLTNLVISDELPEGLEYVAGSLEVDGESVTDADDDDNGHYVDGTVEGQFGDIRDTEWHTLTFEVIVGEGQAGENIENIALVGSDNLDEPDEPEEQIRVYPREPNLEAEKSAVNLEEGKDNFEVGDTVVYTIQARNSVSDSLIEDFKIIDELPTGLTFVEGSLEVSHDGVATFSDGVITVNFGDVEDTEWRTLTFEAVVQSGQTGNIIKNIATVDGINIDEPVKPEAEIVIDFEKTKEPVKPSEPEQPNEGNKLPKTATSIFNFIVAGLGLIGIGFLLFIKRRRTA